MTAVPGTARRAFWLAPLLSLPLHGIYLGSRVQRDYAAFAAAYVLLSVLYLVSLVGLGRRNGASARAILAFAVLFRLVHLGYEPFLSDDLYRYRWDGKVQAAGINPYRFPADAPELARLRDETWDEINHRDLPTVYPPLAQAAYLAVYRACGTPLGYRMGFLLFDLGLILVLMRVAHERHAPLQRTLVYAWNPLAIQEFAGHGHVDAMALFFFWLAILALVREKPLHGQAWLALSVLSKLIGGIVWPQFVRRVNILKAGLVFGGILVLGYLPYLGVGRKVLGNLGGFARHWEFNASVFPVLRSILGGSGDHARLACLGLLVVAVAVLRWKDRDDVRACAMAFTAWACLTTTLHPWYILWLLPFACVLPLRSAIWLTLAGGLAYFAKFELLAGRAWHESAFIRLLEYGVFYPLLAVDLAVLYGKGKRPVPLDSREA